MPAKRPASSPLKSRPPSLPAEPSMPKSSRNARPSPRKMTSKSHSNKYVVDLEKHYKTFDAVETPWA